MDSGFEPRFGKTVIPLFMGDIVATDDDVMYSTILGSCVSVVLHDPRRGAGGMIHYLMPDAPDRPLAPEDAGEYGGPALAALVGKMEALGCRAANLQAKVFGGSSLLLPREAGVYSVGPRNVRVATDFLESRGIPVVRSSVGGNFGRRLYFDVRSFVVYVRKFRKSPQGAA